MTVKQKGAFYVGLLAVVSTLLVFVVFTNLNKLTSILRTSLPEEMHELNADLYIRYSADMTMYYDEVLTQSARNYAFTGDSSWLSRYREAEIALDALVQRALETGSENDNSNFRKLQEANLALVQLEYSSIAHRQQGEAAKAVALLESEQYQYLKQAYKASVEEYLHSKRGEVYNTVRTIEELVSEHASSEEAVIADMKMLIIVFTFLLLLTALLIALSYTRMVTSSVDTLKNGASAIAKGDFDAKIALQSEDEFEELADAMNKMGRDLKVLTQKINEETLRIELSNQRESFSRELHDRLGIIISSLKLQLESFKPPLAQEQTVQLLTAYRTCKELLIEAYAEIRELSDNPLERTLQEKGLNESLSNLFLRTEMIFPVKVKFITSVGDQNWQAEDKASIYSLVRELLNNAIKHGKAELVEIQLIAHDEHCMLMIEDDGCGFDTTSLKVQNGTGLQNARHRVEHLGGNFHLDSEPGRGTCISIELPSNESVLV